MFIRALSVAGALTQTDAKQKYNVLFIISDDLTATALSCYGSEICKTPNIDRIAQNGVRYTRAYCQATFCPVPLASPGHRIPSCLKRH